MISCGGSNYDFSKFNELPQTFKPNFEVGPQDRLILRPRAKWEEEMQGKIKESFTCYKNDVAKYLSFTLDEETEYELYVYFRLHQMSEYIEKCRKMRSDRERKFRDNLALANAKVREVVDARRSNRSRRRSNWP